MASNLDTAILLGKETTYGTPVALTNAYEGKADSWKRETQILESLGFRAGYQARRSDRRTVVNMGGTGTLEFDLLNMGFGFVAQAMLGSVSGPTQEGATTAYTSTFATTADDPGDSYTVQVQRVTAGTGSVESFTHHGSTVTGWQLSQDTSGYASLSLDFDFEDVETVTADGTAVYPANATPFDWTQCAVTVDSVATDVQELSLDADLGLNVDRRFLKGSALKSRPVRSAIPTFSGSINSEFASTTLYDHWVADDIIPITFTWTGVNIEGAFDYELVVTMANCQFTGESPEASVEDLAAQPMAFDVLYDGSTDAVVMTYTSTDTSL